MQGQQIHHYFHCCLQVAGIVDSSNLTPSFTASHAVFTMLNTAIFGAPLNAMT